MSVDAKCFLLGASGVLGSEIALQLSGRAIIITSDTYCRWCEPGGKNFVGDYFRDFESDEKVIFVAAGLTDPSKSSYELDSANYYLPRNILEGLNSDRATVITFGTVMEKLSPNLNNYVNSKVKFYSFLGRSNLRSKSLHIQLHTVYGAKTPARHMFLGQVISSLIHDTGFQMTSGQQYREYHHVSDVITVTRQLVDKGLVGVLDLSSGRPVKLVDLASIIFDSFGKKHLLQIGRLKAATDEVLELPLKANPLVQSSAFRDPTIHILKYINAILEQGQNAEENDA